jgi:hypothetical protein
MTRTQNANMRTVLWTGVIVVLGISAALTVYSAGWRTRSFELRRDRLYFPAGEEALIFTNSPFVVLRNNDTVYTGLIEHTWEGVSASGLMHGCLDNLPLTNLEVVIAQAEIDSAQSITVGSDLSELALRSNALDNSHVSWKMYKDGAALREDFAAGLLDAIVMLSDLDPRPAEGTTLSAPCPFIAVMVPQVGREFNYHGELTTSLYYRFDNSRVALCFRGDEVGRVNRLTQSLPGNPALPRWYDFDPARGKKLFDRMSHRPSRIRLYSGHTALDGLMRYFADILSRDRCVVELTSDRSLADVSVEFIPYSETSPLTAIDTLVHRMTNDAVNGSAPAEYLQQINHELSSLVTASLPEDSIRCFETVSRIMAEDLGVFPLFRPTLFVHAHQQLRNTTLDPSGLVDFSKAIKVKLPHTPSGGLR